MVCINEGETVASETVLTESRPPNCQCPLHESKFVSCCCSLWISESSTIPGAVAEKLYNRDIS